MTRSDANEVDALDWLEGDELIVAVLPGVGASLVATNQRVLIVRTGADFRPRNGVQSWAYARIVGVSLSPPMRGQAVIVIRTGRYPWQAVTMFFDSRLRVDAERVIGQIRTRL
jgi:hypothetical protein